MPDKNINEKIEIIKIWINEIQRNQPLAVTEPTTIQTLNEIIRSIYPDNPPFLPDQNAPETFSELESWIRKRIKTLRSLLKQEQTNPMGAKRKTDNAPLNVQQSLQNHISDLVGLNQRLKAQMEETLRVQRLEKEERVLTDALRDTLATISSTLDLGKILDHILDNVERVTPYDGANVILVESDLVHVARQRQYIQKEQSEEQVQQQIPITKLAILQQLLELGKALAIPDTSSSPLWIGFPDVDWVNSNVIAPIRSNGKILGFLSLDSATKGYFTEVHAERLQSFADQAAIAIQNARLLDRAKQVAVKNERNRIANELHDTISQTLWSVILITERLPIIWEIDKEQGQTSLHTVHQLAENALEEMRALLLELRPSALEDEKLGDIIRQVATIIAKRAGLDVSIEIENQEAVPSEVHFVLYRVVQEALNNVAHHALASQIKVYYSSLSGRVEIRIEDNGIGFDPTAIEAGRLGISIMRDRIDNIGGHVEIMSKKDGGTTIRIRWDALSNESLI